MRSTPYQNGFPLPRPLGSARGRFRLGQVSNVEGRRQKAGDRGRKIDVRKKDESLLTKNSLSEMTNPHLPGKKIAFTLRRRLYPPSLAYKQYLSKAQQLPHVNNDFDPAVFCLAGGCCVGSNGLAFPATYRPYFILRNTTLDKVSSHRKSALGRKLPVVFPF